MKPWDVFRLFGLKAYNVLKHVFNFLLFLVIILILSEKKICSYSQGLVMFLTFWSLAFVGMLSCYGIIKQPL